MTVYAFYIFDRHAACIYKRRWYPSSLAGAKPARPASRGQPGQPNGSATSRTPLSGDDDAKLIFGTVFSLRKIVRKLGGEDDSFLSYRTSQYKLHYYETPTNIKFVMLTDTKSSSMRIALQQIYVNCYVEYVVKNPLSPVDHPGGIGVNNELFEASLGQFVPDPTTAQTPVAQVPEPVIFNRALNELCTSNQHSALYADFELRSEIANWINVVGFIFEVFLLLSFAFLAPKWTHRHYLSACMTTSVLFMSLAFMIPLGSKPHPCFNQITPNDMRSSGTCAASGSFLLFGGWSVVIWAFLRALSLHLQICWEVTLGNKFLWSSLTLGWGIPAVGLTLVLALTGVSYRFGNVCHVNHKLALQDFWGPLLVFAAMAMVLQFITMAYCIHVFIKGLSDDKTTTNSTGRPPTSSGSITTASARQTYRRVKQVVKLQWRGAAVVLVIIAEVAFFAAVFVSMDNSSQVSDRLFQKSLPWLLCLVETAGDKDQCLYLIGDMVRPERVVLPVLIFLGLTGFWCLLFFGRWSMILGWIDLFKRNWLRRKHEFVSADARRFSGDPRYVSSPMASTDPYSTLPDKAYSPPLNIPPTLTWQSTLPPKSSGLDAKDRSDGGQARVYVTPVDSYSVPRPTSEFGPTDWAQKGLHTEGTPSSTPLAHQTAQG
ncbi:hypothetical protein DV737_g2627, partial [Chaetothyriales sp. CBS 132003]